MKLLSRSFVLSSVSIFLCALFFFCTFAMPNEQVMALAYDAASNISVQEERDPAVSAEASAAQTTDGKIRQEQGIVSQLATDKHNPYNGQMRLQIDVGSEFAEFDGSDTTEGIIIKVTPGGEVDLPVVHAREGYYFLGWCQGGVPETPTWDLFTDSVEITDDTSQGKNMTVYALYAAENGDGYCTCGAWTEGVYADQMQQIKANAAEYNAQHGLSGHTFSFGNAKTLIPAAILALLIVFIIVITYSKVIEHSLDKKEQKAKEQSSAEESDTQDK